jgi:hypothetical protein
MDVGSFASHVAAEISLLQRRRVVDSISDERHAARHPLAAISMRVLLAKKSEQSGLFA